MYFIYSLYDCELFEVCDGLHGGVWRARVWREGPRCRRGLQAKRWDRREQYSLIGRYLTYLALTVR